MYDVDTASLKLADLGLDSLGAVEVGFELERLIPEKKISNELLLHPDTTIRTILDSIDTEPNSPSSSTDTLVNCPQSPPSDNDFACSEAKMAYHDDSTERALKMLDRIGPNPEIIQDKPQSESLPMVLIHDGGGTALAYRLLGDLGRTLLGIHNPGIKDGKGVIGIRHAADQYASYIRRWLHHSSSLHSKVLVGGWSMGGTIAVTLASAHPDLVAGVVLLDPPPPGISPMTAVEAGFLIPTENSRSTMGFNKLVREQVKTNAQALRDLDLHVLIHQLQAPCYLVSATDRFTVLGENVSKIAAGSCADWMTCSDRAAFSEDAWSKVLGARLIGSRRTVGDHFTMFTPAHAGATTSALLHATKALEAGIQ